MKLIRSADLRRAAIMIRRPHRLGGAAPCRERRSGALRPEALLLAIALGQCLTGVGLAESLRFINYTTANGLGNDQVRSVYASGSNVYATTTGTSGGGVNISTNGGASFVYSGTASGLSTSVIFNDVYAVGNTVYAASTNAGGAQGGVSISTDGGASFVTYGTASGLGSTNVTGLYAVGSTV